MRRNRKNKAETPAQAPAAVPAPGAPDDALRALRERLEQLEQRAVPDAPWHPLDVHRRERARWIAANTRTDHTDPCPACGAAGGEQRRTSPDVALLASEWLCVACSGAVEIGWGTNSRRLPPRNECLDRLASLVVAQIRPTPGFRVLAGRYGLTFSLASATTGGDGTAWSHLGDLARWREVGALATRRAAAGMGVFPATELVPEELHLSRVYDPHSPAGFKSAMVPAEQAGPSAHDVAEQLRAEESAVERILREQAAAAKEREVKAAKDAERARVEREYRAAVKAQEAMFQEERRRLRETRSQVLAAANTKIEFNTIVRNI